MATDIKESDWKVFRRLHKIALERFCQRVLKEVQAAAAEHTDGYHDTYLKVFTLVRDRDKQSPLSTGRHCPTPQTYGRGLRLHD
jgi:DNA-directed RNA polymerase specialized sigma24 family protein